MHPKRLTEDLVRYIELTFHLRIDWLFVNNILGFFLWGSINKKNKTIINVGLTNC